MSPRQDGNPVLRHVRNVRWQFAPELTPDFLFSASAAGLFLSLRYHLLHPTYVVERLKQIRSSYRLRVLMCHVDVADPVASLGDVNRAALAGEATLVCAFSLEEAGRYLETFKVSETSTNASLPINCLRPPLIRRGVGYTCPEVHIDLW